jgi:SAM-dependent methyltransferase
MAPPAPAAAAASPPALAGAGAASDEEKRKAVAMFKQSWEVYTKVVEADHMSHAVLYDALAADMLGRHASRGGFSLVDLGCGGADALAAMFRRAPPALAAGVRSYTGVDLSDVALAHARANLLGGPVGGGFPDVRASAPEAGVLPSLSADARFEEADMVSFAESLPENSADVVLAAFALHHLTPAQKDAVLRAAARALKKPGGTFYYLDVWMEAGGEGGGWGARGPSDGPAAAAADEEEVTREAYLARYKALMDGWPTLGAAEAAFVWDHVSAYDFPAREREVGATPHFGRAEVVARGGWPHALMRLTGPRA